MAKESSVKFTGSWKEFDRLFKPGPHKKMLNKHLKKSTSHVGRFVQKAMKGVIATGRFRKNANLTIALKHHGRPLMHSTQMQRSVLYKRINNTSVFIGILRSDEAFERAKTVHGTTSRGAVIRVTDKMRNMFQLLAKVSNGEVEPGKLNGRAAELWKAHPGKWYPIAKSTRYIRIRPRPFVTQTVMNRRLHKQVANIWLNGIQDGYNEITKKVNRKR